MREIALYVEYGDARGRIYDVRAGTEHRDWSVGIRMHGSRMYRAQDMIRSVDAVQQKKLVASSLLLRKDAVQSPSSTPPIHYIRLADCRF